MNEIPKTQRAVQLIGPDKLTLNTSKEIVRPGPHQVLCKIESVGLCFSDLKLLKQFSSHARKTPVKSGIDANVLDQISSYVPNDVPTVPGHEAVVRIAAVGKGVTAFNVGQRFLVQTDYRWLPTASSNAAFSYNFEGALQEYVLMDERVITSPEGDSMLIPASEKLSASAIALVEPWACVEDSYAAKDRRTLRDGGRMLVVIEEGDRRSPLQEVIKNLFERYGRPAQVAWLGESLPDSLGTKLTTNEHELTRNKLNIEVVAAKALTEFKDAYYDDVIYFGANAATVETLFWKVAPRGLINIVQCGRKFGKAVVTTVGRVHYGGIRIIGTTGSDPAESMATIPLSGEIRKGDNVNVIGAGGPMGVMHVIRNICQGVAEVTIFAGDLDDARLATLTKVAKLLAEKNKVSYRPYNPGKEILTTNEHELTQKLATENKKSKLATDFTDYTESKKEQIPVQFDYVAIMTPVPALVAQAVKTAADGAIINIFAGIPAQVTGEIDLDAYIEKRLYFIGTSGSVLEDMKLVLAKVESGRLDTNLSVAAICGLEGAVEGIRAVEKALIPGKILVYPACKGLGLITLDKLSEKLPSVAAKLKNNFWNIQAESALLEGSNNG